MTQLTSDEFYMLKKQEDSDYDKEDIEYLIRRYNSDKNYVKDESEKVKINKKIEELKSLI